MYSKRTLVNNILSPASQLSQCISGKKERPHQFYDEVQHTVQDTPYLWWSRGLLSFS